jgi:hypothetical protein
MRILFSLLTSLALCTNAAHLFPHSTLTFVEPEGSTQRNLVITAWTDSDYEVVLSSTLEDGSIKKSVLSENCGWSGCGWNAPYEDTATLEGTGPWTVSGFCEHLPGNFFVKDGVAGCTIQIKLNGVVMSIMTQDVYSYCLFFRVKKTTLKSSSRIVEFRQARTKTIMTSITPTIKRLILTSAWQHHQTALQNYSLISGWGK